MTSASPTIVALQTNSAWVLILGVSLVTLVAALFIRRVIGRPGGFASGFLLALPLLLPLLAALAYSQGLLPEFAVLRPAGEAIVRGGGDLSHLLVLFDQETGKLTPYALTESAGPWLLVIGLSVSSFMLLRRWLGTMMVGRLIRRSRPACPEKEPELCAAFARLAAIAGLKKIPELLLLPPGVPGAFAVGVRSRRILVSPDLVRALEPAEMEGILAHEMAHLEARDVPVVFSAGLMRDMVAWNPFAHIGYRRLVMDRELAADRRAIGLTGDPLSLASGLVKVCRLVRAHRGYGYRTALAIWRPGSRLSRRVTTMLAVADGRVPVSSARSLPYVVAACMVAVLGLQAGAQIAAQGGGAVAIMWGAPERASQSTWRPGAKADPKTRGAQPAKARTDDHLSLGFSIEDAVAVKEKDFGAWLKDMKRRAQRRGVSPAILRFERLQNWSVRPILAGDGMGLGIYRIEPSMLKRLTKLAR